jgi:hypothetical protein
MEVKIYSRSSHDESGDDVFVLRNFATMMYGRDRLNEQIG